MPPGRVGAPAPAGRPAVCPPVSRPWARARFGVVPCLTALPPRSQALRQHLGAPRSGGGPPGAAPPRRTGWLHSSGKFHPGTQWILGIHRSSFRAASGTTSLLKLPDQSRQSRRLASHIALLPASRSKVVSLSHRVQPAEPGCPHACRRATRHTCSLPAAKQAGEGGWFGQPVDKVDLGTYNVRPLGTEPLFLHSQRLLKSQASKVRVQTRMGRAFPSLEDCPLREPSTPCHCLLSVSLGVLWPE